MKNLRLVLLAMLLIVPFAAIPAHAQVAVGIGVGPAVVAAPYAYGPPVCDWGYYPYYPYACAPYGYYGPSWFVSGVFIGAGPWYGWGRGHYHYGWGYRGGYYSGPHPTSYRGAYGGARAFNNGGGYRGGYAGGGHVATGVGGARMGGGFGGGFHGGGGGGFHGGGGHR